MRCNPDLFSKFADIYKTNTHHADRLAHLPTNSHPHCRNSYIIIINVYNNLPKTIKEYKSNLFNKKLFNWLVDYMNYVQ